MSRPTFLSLSLAVDTNGLETLGRTLSSLAAQQSDEWELLAYPASDDVSVGELRAAITEGDRTRVLDLHGSAAERAQGALDMVQGEFSCAVTSGLELAPDAVAALQRAAASTPELDVAYTDEAVLAASGSPVILHKPTWSPERLRGHAYMGHLLALRTRLAREVGGFRPEVDGAHQLDLLLRVCEAARSIERVPVVGVSRPGGLEAPDQAAWRSGVAVVQQHLDRVGLQARAGEGPVPGTYRIDRRLPPQVSVSVVIPTRGGKGLAWGERRSYVVEAVRSVLADVEHRRCDVVVVHNQDMPAPVLEQLGTLGPRVRVDGHVGPFNFARMCNRGVTVSGGQVVVLLDERTEIGSDDFVGRLVAPLLEPGVGLVGPRVLASDGRVLDAGLARFQDMYEPMLLGELGDDETVPALAVNRECSALAATCLALTREVYEGVGGFNERHQRSAHVDLASKIARLGLRRLWVADATLRHFPPPGARVRVTRGDRRWLASRWVAPDLDEFAPAHGARQLRRAHRLAEEDRADRLARRDTRTSDDRRSRAQSERAGSARAESP